METNGDIIIDMINLALPFFQTAFLAAITVLVIIWLIYILNIIINIEDVLNFIDKIKTKILLNYYLKKHANASAKNYITFRETIKKLNSEMKEDNKSMKSINRQSDFIFKKFTEDPKRFSPFVNEFEISFSLIVHVYEEAEKYGNQQNPDVIKGIEEVVSVIYNKFKRVDTIISNTEEFERDSEVGVLVKQLRDELKAIRPEDM